MEFKIQSAQEVVSKKNLEIRKWDGLTHAILRAGLGEAGQSKDWKELQKEFSKLAAESRAAILALAQEISAENQPFHAPVSGQASYSVDKKSYTAQKIVHATAGQQSGAVSKQSGNASVTSSDSKTTKPTEVVVSAASKSEQHSSTKTVEQKSQAEKTSQQKAAPVETEAKISTPKSTASQKTEEKQSTKPVAQSENTERSALLLDPTDSVVFRDGAYYIVGKNGKSKAIPYKDFLNSKDAKSIEEATAGQKKRISAVNTMAIFLEAYTAEYPQKTDAAAKVWGMMDEFVMGKKFTFDEIIKPLGVHALSAAALNEVFTEPVESIRRLKLYKIIKNDLGQYDLVPSQIARQRFGHWSAQQTWEMAARLAQWKDIDFSRAGMGKIDSVRLSEEIRAEIASEKVKYEENWAKNLPEYAEIFKKQFNTDKPLTADQLEQAHAIYLKNSMDQAFKMAALRGQLKQQVGLTGDHADPELDIASSIMGTGTFNMSSRAAREGSKMIAIEALAIAAGALTVGAGTFAVNAIAAASQGARIARLANYGSRVNTLTRWAAGFAGKAVAQGTAFELAHGWVKWGIEGGDMYTVRGFGDSILFMGVLGGVSKILAGTNKLAQWSRTGNGFVQFGKGTVIDGTALGLTSVASKIGGQLAFDEKFTYSPEEIAQAFIMAGLFRGAGKAAQIFKVSREPNGGMEVKPLLLEYKKPLLLEHTPTTQPAPRQNSETGSYKKTTPEITTKYDGWVHQTTAMSARFRQPSNIVSAKMDGNNMNQPQVIGDYVQRPIGNSTQTPTGNIADYQQMYTHLAPKGGVKSNASAQSTETPVSAESAPSSTQSATSTPSSRSNPFMDRVNRATGVQRNPKNIQPMSMTEAYKARTGKEALSSAEHKAQKMNQTLETYLGEIESQFAPTIGKIRGVNTFVKLGDDFIVERKGIMDFSLTNLKSGQKYEGLSRAEMKTVITERYTNSNAVLINAAEKAVLAGDTARIAELAKLEGRRLEDYTIVDGRIIRI